MAGRRAGYAVEYRFAPDRAELLSFWQAPPDPLLSRDGCLLTRAMR